MVRDAPPTPRLSTLHVIAVGGLDPSGGAGVLRDWATCRALDASCDVVATAWTDQDAAGVRSVELRSPLTVARGMVAACERAAADRVRVAVKIGMVGDAAMANALAESVDQARAAIGQALPVVFDPVLSASSGGGLFDAGPDGHRALDRLIARATVVTPNAGELRWLTNASTFDEEAVLAAARQLVARGAPAVLAKGGHVAGAAATDWLVDALKVRRFVAARAEGDPRGTGCALASAIAVALARGEALDEACGSAKRWLRERIAAAVEVRGALHLP